MFNLINQLSLLRFNYTLPLHQKATKNKLYKRWSEAKFSSQFNLLLLLGFSVGVFSGLGVTLPSGVWSFISGEPAMNKVSSSGVGKSTLDIRNGIISYIEDGGTKKFFDLATQRHIEEASLPESWGPIANTSDPVLIDEGNLVVKDAATQITYPIASSESVDKIMADGSSVVWRTGADHNSYGINLYDLSVDSDGNGTPNYKEVIKPEPDPAHRYIFAPGSGQLRQFELVGALVVYNAEYTWGETGAFVYDTATDTQFTLTTSYVYDGTIGGTAQTLYMAINDGSSPGILAYDLSVDSDSDGVPNYKELVRPNPDPAQRYYQTTGDFYGGTPALGFYEDKYYFTAINPENNRDAVFSLDPSQNLQKIITDNKIVAYGGIAVADGKIVFVSNRDNNNPEVFYTSLIEDSTEPYFVNLPNSNSVINLAAGQIIQQPDINIRVKPQDASSQISKVVFYLENYELGTDYAKDSSGVFSANVPIPINKPGGINVRVRAYDQAYNYKETSVSILPDPMMFPYVNTQKVISYVEGEGTLRNKFFDGERVYYENALGLFRESLGGSREELVDDESAGYIGRGALSESHYCTNRDLYQFNCFEHRNPEPLFSYQSDSLYYPPFYVKDNSVYWLDQIDSSGYLYRKNLLSDLETEVLYQFNLSEGVEFPNYLTVSNGYLYFKTYDPESGRSVLTRVGLVSGSPQQLLNIAGLNNYHATDNYVAYTLEEAGGNNLYLKHISTGQTSLVSISNDEISDIFLTDSYLVWEDYVGSNKRIVLFDIDREKKIFLTDIDFNELTGSYSEASNPFVSGNKVFWNADNGDGNDDIYMAELSYADIIKPTITSVDGLFGTTGETASISVSATDNVKATRAKISVKGGPFVDMNGFESPFTYTLPIPAVSSDNIPVSIRVYDIAGNNITAQYNVEVADNDTPFVASIEGNRVTTGETTTVRVKALDNIAISRIDISIDSSVFKPMKLVTDRYEYLYTAPTNLAGNFNMKIRIVDSSGVLFEKSNAVMTVIDNDPPEIKNVGTRKINGNDTEIIVSATDNIAPVRGMITVDNVLWTDMTGTSSPFTYTIKNRDLRLLDKDGNAIYYVRVFDAAGNYDTTEPNKVPYVNIPKNEDEDNQGFLANLANIATSVQGVIRDIAKNTPAPIARSFPFVLFAVLTASGLIFLKQASAETEQISVKQQILAVRKSVAEEKTNFVMLASHYIRTPITIIVGGIDSLLKKYPLGKQAEIKTLCKELVQKTTETVAEIENNPVLNEINSPDIKKETFKIYLSPFFILPVVIVAGLTGFAVTVFEDAQVYKASTLEIITYVLFFIIAVQLFGYFFRKRAIQKDNLAYFDRTIEYQLEMDEARVKFMVKVKTDLEKALSELKKSLGSNSNKMTKEGFSRIEIILEKMGYLSTLKIDHAKKSKKSTPLNLMVNQAIKESKEEIKAKKVSVKRNGLAVRTHQNEEVVTKILSEVISNAIKFSPVSGEVVVEAIEKQSGIEIRITDSGKGISVKDQEFLFKPFSRAKSALDFDYEGIGLGLYYARSLSNMLGGDLSLSSATGKGTKITIIL